VTRCATLDINLDNCTLEGAEAAVTIGQTTIVEFMFVEALIASTISLEVGKAKINNAFPAMEKANLAQDDINNVVWQFVSRVLSNSPVE